ncbi:MAG: hypothetical protein WKF74_11060 [Pyrinomonadaceae bacterium]
MDVRQTLDTNLNPTQEHDHAHAPVAPTGSRLAILSLAALGVVYGDIGTSPLQKDKRELPQLRVKNKKLRRRNGAG